MAMDYDHAAAYARRMIDILDGLKDASNFAYQNGRDDANPFDDMMMLLRLLATVEEDEARREFIRRCENDIEIEW